MNAIAEKRFIEIQPSVTYGKNSQASTLENKCDETLSENKKEVEGLMKGVYQIMQTLKGEIEEDDVRFDKEIL